MQHTLFASLLPRGVYAPPFLGSHGERCLLAIDSQHRCIYRVRLFEKDDLDAVSDMCRRLLDERDPVPA